MGEQLSAGRCCQQSNVAVAVEYMASRSNAPQEVGGLPQRMDKQSQAAANMESLAYSPVRFDGGTTLDESRAPSRYSDIIVCSTRSRTQSGSKAWSEWLRSATAGCDVAVIRNIALTPRTDGNLSLDTPNSSQHPFMMKIPGKYQLDPLFTKLTIFTHESTELPAEEEVIDLDKIQVVCTASDFPLFLNHLETQLNDVERNSAVMLQYVTDTSATKRNRVVFIESDEASKERFVQTFTALWLERREKGASSLAYEVHE